MTTPIEPTSIIMASQDVVASDVDNEIMLIEITSGRYFGLDMVGSEIWRHVQQPISIEALAEKLLNRFKGDPKVIDAEARDFVAKLHDRGLVRIVADGDTQE